MMVQATGYFPSALAAADDPKLLKPYYEKNPNHLVAIRQLPNRPAGTPSPATTASRSPT